MSDARAILRDVFARAVAAMDPEARVRGALASRSSGLGRGEVVGIAVGKAACAMARGAAGVCVRGPVRGLIVAPEMCDAAPWPVMVGSHPVPDARSLAAGRAMIELVRGVPPDGTLLALISGGASALAEVPADGVTLDELVARVREVVARGAPIAEINRVRASLSAIKAGKLARLCAGRVVTLVASDVVGDDPRVVGSGPTVDPGDRGNVAAITRGDVEVVAGIGDLARAAVDAARAHGIDAAIPPGGDAVTGDVEDVAARLAALADAPGPPLYVLAGEPTVRLPDSPGTGGRAQQLALLVARSLASLADRASRAGRASRASAQHTFLACGSDGLDGTGPAAGAIVDGATWSTLLARGADPEAALARCDAGTALAVAGDLVVTGRTGVNHADLMLLWRRPA